MAALLESSRWSESRWELAESDLNRIWQLCVLLFVGGIALAFSSGEGANPFSTYLEASNWTERSRSLNTAAVTVMVFIQWLPMIFFPRAAITHRLIRTPWIIVPPALCYLAFAAPHMPELLSVFADPSPVTLAAVMAKPWAASMFWAYAGAFDLFVGRWMYLDSRERDLHPLWVSPALFVAILFGPLGFLMYAVVRALHAGRGPAPDQPTPADR